MHKLTSNAFFTASVTVAATLSCFLAGDKRAIDNWMQNVGCKRTHLPIQIHRHTQ